MQAETKQIRIADSILMEMDQEAEITRRLLDIIPDDKLGWRPHPKAKSLGELAMHLAMLQRGVAEFGQPDTADFSDLSPEPEAASRAQILETFAESLKKAKEIVGSTDDARALAEWKVQKDGSTIMAMPRIAFWRSILLEPQLSSSRPAFDLSSPAGRSAALDLRAERRHKPVYVDKIKHSLLTKEGRRPVSAEG